MGRGQGHVTPSNFSKRSGYISKTVQNSDMVTMGDQQEIVCSLSNGDIADDLD